MKFHPLEFLVRNCPKKKAHYIVSLHPSNNCPERLIIGTKANYRYFAPPSDRIIRLLRLLLQIVEEMKYNQALYFYQRIGHQNKT